MAVTERRLSLAEVKDYLKGRLAADRFLAEDQEWPLCPVLVAMSCLETRLTAGLLSMQDQDQDQVWRLSLAEAVADCQEALPAEDPLR